MNLKKFDQADTNEENIKFQSKIRKESHNLPEDPVNGSTIESIHLEDGILFFVQPN